MQTIRFAARLLSRSPLFSLAAVSILAAGIAVNTIMFSIVSGVLLRPLPFPAPERLVSLNELRREPPGGGPTRVAAPTLMAWQQHQSAVELIAYSEYDAVLTGGEPVILPSVHVTANFFQFLGEPLILGRAFTPSEDVAGAPATVVLGHAVWQERFGGDPGAVGRTLTVGDRTLTIIGVARAGFDFPDGAQLWTPLFPALPDGYERLAGAKFLRVLGRLQPGVSVERAAAELSALAAGVPDNESWVAHVRPLRDELTAEVRPALLMLMAAVTLVLLIACANVGNLLLARGATRTREFAVRAALGASRWRVAGELLAESWVLSAAAGLLGVLAAFWGLDVVLRLMPAQLPRAAEITIDPYVLGFAVIISLITGAVAGLVPVLRTRLVDLTPALKEGSAAAVGLRRGRLRGALVLAEVALSVLLLVAGGLLLRSFFALVSVDPGFRPERVTTFDLHLPTYKYNSWAQYHAITSELNARVAALPGVTAAGTTRNLPVSGRNMSSPVVVEGRLQDPALPQTQAGAVSPDYFRAMGIPLLSGRFFEATDDTGRVAVAIVNETFARTFFPGEDPVGKRARTYFGGSNMKDIVGVVGDTRHHGPMVDPAPMFYTLAAQDLSNHLTLVVRSTGPVPPLISAVRGIVRELDPDQPISDVATMDELLSRSVARPRFYALLLVSFAVLAAVLALLGLYAVMAQVVAQRRHEIGIRMAIGARGGDVLRLVVGQGMRLVIAGALFGVLGALAASRALRSLLFGVQPTDPLTFVVVPLLLIGAAFLAILLPARRAARLDPLRALRA